MIFLSGSRCIRKKIITPMAAADRVIGSFHYMQGVCEETGFFHIGGYTANMNDVFKEKQRRQMERFFRWAVNMVEEGVPTARKYAAVKKRGSVYTPPPVADTPVTAVEKATGTHRYGASMPT